MKSAHILTEDLEIGHFYLCPIKNEYYGILQEKSILDYDDGEKMQAIYRLQFHKKEYNITTVIVRKWNIIFVETESTYSVNDKN